MPMATGNGNGHTASGSEGWGRSSLFGVEIDVVRMEQAVCWVLETAKKNARPCEFVVTPNATTSSSAQISLDRASSRVAPWPMILAIIES